MLTKATVGLVGDGVFYGLVREKEADCFAQMTGDILIEDAWWTAVPNLLIMPFDTTTLRAFIIPPDRVFDSNTLEEMAQAFHKQFVDGSSNRLPDNMKPSQKLKQTFKTANIEQARYAMQILAAGGFVVRPAADPNKPIVFSGFTEGSGSEVERMAEMEHGRWNVDRLRDGWRPGASRDDKEKIHNCIVTWADLPDGIKHYDRDAVKTFPDILAMAGLEVKRK